MPQAVPQPMPTAYARQISAPAQQTQSKPVAVMDADAIFDAEEEEEAEEPAETTPLNTSDIPTQFGSAAARQASAPTPKQTPAPGPTPAPAPTSNAGPVPSRPLPRAANPGLDQAIQNGFKCGLIDNAALAFYDQTGHLDTEGFIAALLVHFPPGQAYTSAYRRIIHTMIKPFLDEFDGKRVQEIAFLTFLLLFGPFDKCYEKFTCLIVPPSADGRPPGRRSWFWGRDTNRGVAASNIQNAEKGTFLIRLSSNGVSFAVTYIDEDGSLKHSRILNSTAGYHFEDQADLFSSLYELVRSFPHIFKCAFRDPNECVTFKPLDGAPIKVPVKQLQQYPQTLLGSMFDPSRDEVEGSEYEAKDFDFAVARGIAQEVVARRAVFSAIVGFYTTGVVKADKLDRAELVKALEFFRIPIDALRADEGR